MTSAQHTNRTNWDNGEPKVIEFFDEDGQVERRVAFTEATTAELEEYRQVAGRHGDTEVVEAIDAELAAR